MSNIKHHNHFTFKCQDMRHIISGKPS